MNATRLIIIITALSLFFGGVFPILVVSESRGNFTLYTPNSLLNNSFWMSAPMKIVNVVGCEIAEIPSDWIGAIWIFTDYGAMGCDWDNKGAMGVIFPGSIYSFRPPGYHYIYDRTHSRELPRGQINISVSTKYSLSSKQYRRRSRFYKSYLKKNQEHSAYLPTEVMNQSILCTILYVIVVACALTAAVLSLVKLGRIIAINGSAFSVSQISLGLISLGSLDLAVVFLYLIVRNHLEIVGLFEVFALFLVFADACQTLACLAICVFWYDIMTDIRGATKKKISKRIAVPLIVAAVVIVALLLTLPFNLLYDGSAVIKILIPAAYFIVALAISISWLVLGSKLLKSLQNKAAVSENKKKMIKKLSNKIFITTALFFGTRVVEVAWTVCELIYTPLSAVLTIALAAIFNVATNAMLSQVFSAPNNSEKGPTECVKLTEQNKPLD